MERLRGTESGMWRAARQQRTVENLCGHRRCGNGPSRIANGWYAGLPANALGRPGECTRAAIEMCGGTDRSRSVTRLPRYAGSQISWTLVHSTPTATRVVDRLSFVLTSFSVASVQTRSVQMLSVQIARPRAQAFRDVFRQTARRVSSQRHGMPTLLPSQLTRSDNASFRRDGTTPWTPSRTRRRT